MEPISTAPSPSRPLWSYTVSYASPNEVRLRVATVRADDPGDRVEAVVSLSLPIVGLFVLRPAVGARRLARLGAMPEEAAVPLVALMPEIAADLREFGRSGRVPAPIRWTSGPGDSPAPVASDVVGVGRQEGS